MKKIAIITCLHGDEGALLEVAKKFRDRAKIIVGNPEGLKQNKRFIEADLNRVFPGNKNGTKYEERRAAEILEEIKGYDQVIDLHSSSSNVELFGILTKPNNKNLALAKSLGLKKVVVMSEELAHGKSLLDYHDNSISLEVGPHSQTESMAEVDKSLKGFFNGEQTNDTELERFTVFKLIKCEEQITGLINNFEEVKKGQLIAKGNKEYYAEFDFFPVLVGEKAYKGIICLAAKKEI